LNIGRSSALFHSFERNVATDRRPNLRPNNSNSKPPVPETSQQTDLAAVLEARNLTKTYANGNERLTVLDDVSFAIQPKDTCAIVGPSGSGKTTLLGLCAGLDRETSGSVSIDGVDLRPLDEDARTRLRNERTGFVFQSFHLLPNLTAIENVMMPQELHGRTNVQSSARELLDRVGLGDRLHHYPSQLSGGEQQRVAVARSFINRPRVLFADEPTGNLDNETAAHVIDLIFELNREHQTALILVTHDLELASRTGRVLRLKKGKLIEDRRTSAEPLATA
jgi:putative ABC transport system ATP-binding protein